MIFPVLPNLPYDHIPHDDITFLEQDLKLVKDKERPQQTTLEDLGILVTDVDKNY
jgi:hypothetical protein